MKWVERSPKKIPATKSSPSAPADTMICASAVPGLPVIALFHKLPVKPTATENKLLLAEIMQLLCEGGVGEQWE
mgnify:CR=1 FL=1